MKIIVTGCRGQLGTEIIKQLREGRSEIGPIPEKLMNATVIPVDLPELDITNYKMVDDFILETWTQTAGEKTTIVRAMLRNGFELVEASSCVSPENYDEKLGREICMEKIKDRVWQLLGFLLQTAVNGVR